MTPEETEAERLDLLASFQREAGVQEGFGPGSFGNHELLDRVHLLEATWSRFVREHPSCYLDPLLYRRASEIESLMADFYQSVGQRE